MADRMPDVAIRKMREDDRPPIMQLLSYWNMAPRAPSPDAPDPERSTLLVENTFVANADGVLIGVASYILHDDGSAETASLAVDSAWLGSQVGASLQKARLMEMKARGIERVRTEADRPGVVDWYVRKFRYRIVGTARKKHPFGLVSVDHWTVLELDLRAWQPRRAQDQHSDTAAVGNVQTLEDGAGGRASLAPQQDVSGLQRAGVPNAIKGR